MVPSTLVHREADMCRYLETSIRFGNLCPDCPEFHHQPRRARSRRKGDRPVAERTANTVVLALEGLWHTIHCDFRKSQRGIPQTAIYTVLSYGRRLKGHNGTTVSVIGKADVAHWQNHGVLLETAQGIHVVWKDDGTIITTYRSSEIYRPRRKRCRR